MSELSGKKQQLGFLLLLLLTAVGAVIAYRPINPQWVLYSQAEKSYSQGQFQQAADLFQQASSAGLAAPLALAKAGDSYFASGRFQEAQDLFLRLHQQYPGDQTLTMRLAKAYQYLKQPELALSLYADQERGQPLELALMVHRGDLQKSINEFIAAEASYRAALTLRPGAPLVELRLAELLTWQKRYPEAEDLLRQVLAADPAMTQARKHLARVLARQGKSQQAMEQYRLVLGDNQ